MRLKKEVYDERILRIVGQYMRITDMHGIPHDQFSIRRIAVLHGFTYTYNVEPLEKALPLVRKWIHERRSESLKVCGKPYTPAPMEILMFTLKAMRK